MSTNPPAALQEYTGGPLTTTVPLSLRSVAYEFSVPVGSPRSLAE
jgi:hypothetical protein